MKRFLTVLFLGLNVSGVMAQPVLASESSGFKEVTIQELDCSEERHDYRCKQCEELHRWSHSWCSELC